MTQFCQLRYEGPSALFTTAVRLFREAGVTLASVCVADGKVVIPGTQATLALLIQCEGGRDAIDAVLARFAEDFTPQAALQKIPTSRTWLSNA